MTRTRPELAEDLRAIAPGKSDGEKALRDLARTLEDGKLSDLVGIDLAQAYAPEVMLPEETGERRALTVALEVIRDVLVFVPVMFMWWQLSSALGAWNAYTGTDPFLLAWQHGFGGRAWPLSADAVVVATVVLAVVLLTLGGHIVRDRSERGTRHRQQRLAVLLAEAGITVSGSLAGNKTDVTRDELAKISDRIASSALSLQDALTKTGSDITDAVNTSPGSKLHDMFEKWTAAASDLSALGKRLDGTQDMLNTLHETQTALSRLSQQIGQETTTLVSALQSERESRRQEEFAHNSAASGVADAAEKMREAFVELSGQAEQFNEMVHRLAFLIESLDGSGPTAGVGGGLN